MPWPLNCGEKQITQVVPPNAADVVALSNVSALAVPSARGCSIWQWLSTPPGMTSLPVASISRSAGPSALPNAAILPPWMPTSHKLLSVAVTTVPLRMIRS